MKKKHWSMNFLKISIFTKRKKYEKKFFFPITENFFIKLLNFDYGVAFLRLRRLKIDRSPIFFRNQLNHALCRRPLRQAKTFQKNVHFWCPTFTTSLVFRRTKLKIALVPSSNGVIRRWDRGNLSSHSPPPP